MDTPAPLAVFLTDSSTSIHLNIIMPNSTMTTVWVDEATLLRLAHEATGILWSRGAIAREALSTPE